MKTRLAALILAAAVLAGCGIDQSKVCQAPHTGPQCTEVGR
jgi:hypothetical protein